MYVVTYWKLQVAAGKRCLFHEKDLNDAIFQTFKELNAIVKAFEGLNMILKTFECLKDHI